MRHLSWGSYYHFVKKKQFAIHRSLKWLTLAQYEHDPEVKVQILGKLGKFAHSTGISENLRRLQNIFIL